jgi:hypothetical protein
MSYLADAISFSRDILAACIPTNIRMLVDDCRINKAFTPYTHSVITESALLVLDGATSSTDVSTVAA